MIEPAEKDESILRFFPKDKPDPSMEYKIIIEAAANIEKPKNPH